MIRWLENWRARQLPPWVSLKTTGSAARILWRRLGAGRTAVVLAEVAGEQARGAPFQRLPPPVDHREALSRQQAGPAVLLHRALRRRLAPAEALDVTREVVQAGAIIFLSHSIGPLDRDRLDRLSPVERDDFAREIGERFFNATIQWEEISRDRVCFTVTQCLFPALCQAVDAPEVAPLLCAGDAVYFGETLPAVRLIRPHTIADGARSCPFELKWK